MTLSDKHKIALLWYRMLHNDLQTANKAQRVKTQTEGIVYL